MSKPITEWGDEEVKAMFGGLPDGSAIIRRGEFLTVANVRSVESESSCEDDIYSVYRTVKTRLILELDRGTDSYAVQRTMPRRTDEGDVEEMRKHLEKVTELARKIGPY